MKHFKRTLSVLLTAVMLTSAVASGGITIHASEDEVAVTPVDTVAAVTSGTEDEMSPDVFPDIPADPVNIAEGTCGDDLRWTLDDGRVFVLSGQNPAFDIYRAKVNVKNFCITPIFLDNYTLIVL